jgi:heptosyltransferase-2
VREAGKPKVLLVRLSSLGDVVLATAAVEALREDRPSAEVHVLTKRPFAGVFENHPGVSRVLAWEAGEGIFPVARRVRAGRYDCIVDLHRSLRTMGLRCLLRSGRWTSYRKGAVGRRLAVGLRRPALLGDAHVVDRYLAALAPLGVTARRRLPKVYPSNRDRDAVARLLGDAGW